MHPYIYVALLKEAGEERTVTGAFSQGFLTKVAVLSSLLMITGGMNMPGTAIPVKLSIA